METIGKTTLWSYLDGSSDATEADNTRIREGRGHKVKSYLDLATKVAELQFRNLDQVLLFRGQNADYRNLQNKTSLKPSLFRSERGSTADPGADKLTARYDTLTKAQKTLSADYTGAELLGFERLQRHQILQWSILQHYEVCPTPLLDVTHSLRIAASFASHSASKWAYLFVLGVPNLSGAITASAEAGLQIVRLSSVCPPSAVRPHLQEGYLLGEYPEMTGYDQKELYFSHEIDFGRRLVAKFRFAPASFWTMAAFPMVEKEALYPTDDPLLRLANQVKEKVNPA